MRLRLIVLLLLVPFSRGQQQMSHEEQVVRTTYARLAFAQQVGEVHLAITQAQISHQPLDAKTLATRLKNSELKFVLSDFKGGNVTDPDIGQMRYDQLMVKPVGGDELDIGHGGFTWATDAPGKPVQTQSLIAQAQWHKAQNLQNVEDWTVKWSDMFPKIENSSWFSRYIRYRVKVTFAGRSLEYPAMFLFGQTPSGEEYVLPADTIVNLSGGSLEFFIKRDAYPEALIEGGIGKEFSAVHDWLVSQGVTTGKKHTDNCDPATLHCGISQSDLDKSAHPAKIDELVPAKPLSVPHRIDVSFHPMPPLRPMLQASCADFSTAVSHVGFLPDTQLHIFGDHELNDLVTTSCTYSSGASSNCDTQCQVSPVSAIMSDNGLPIACHVVNKQVASGGQNGVGTGSTCAGGAGGGVKQCLSCLCSVTVTYQGVSVGFGSDGFYTANDNQGQVCSAEANPQATPTPTPPGGGGGPIDPCLEGGATAPGPTGDFGGTGGTGGGRNAPDCSPIIVDLTGNGFALTDAQHGVMFDIANTGTPLQIAWTANANNAWLVLDRNQNGIINSGAEMFGNFTAQPASPRPNGFLALRVYDDPANGGNGDGVIDARDKIFSSLRLWVDANHDGISQSGELHTLPELGIYSISLNYSLSYRRDEYGNVFRYKARVNQGMNGPADVGKSAYDVFLVSK
jgi:hypothetical protein